MDGPGELDSFADECLSDPERFIDTALSAQLHGRSIFNDLPVVQHDDAVEIGHRRQPVRHHQHGSAVHQFGECCLNHRFGMRVQCGRRFVKNQDRRILEKDPGQPQSLALTA